MEVDSKMRTLIAPLIQEIVDEKQGTLSTQPLDIYRSKVGEPPEGMTDEQVL